MFWAAEGMGAIWPLDFVSGIWHRRHLFRRLAGGDHADQSQTTGAGVRFIRAAASEVVGLFVGDWLQTAGSVAILALGWAVVSRFHLRRAGVRGRHRARRPACDMQRRARHVRAVASARVTVGLTSPVVAAPVVPKIGPADATGSLGWGSKRFETSFCTCPSRGTTMASRPPSPHSRTARRQR